MFSLVLSFFPQKLLAFVAAGDETGAVRAQLSAEKRANVAPRAAPTCSQTRRRLRSPTQTPPSHTRARPGWLTMRIVSLSSLKFCCARFRFAGALRVPSSRGEIARAPTFILRLSERVRGSCPCAAWLPTVAERIQTIARPRAHPPTAEPRKAAVPPRAPSFPAK